MKKLYGSIVSPFVRKVWLVLKIKNVEFELERLLPFIPEHKEKLLTMNPLGKIPIYQEDDFVLPDTSVICGYLEKQYPNNNIYPTNPQLYARCLWYEEYADTVLMPTILTVFFNTCLAERLGRVIDQKAKNNALEKSLPTIFTYLDHTLSHQTYLVGETLTLADIATVVGFLNLELAGHWIDEEKWPNLAKYLNILNQGLILEVNAIAKIAYDKSR